MADWMLVSKQLLRDLKDLLKSLDKSPKRIMILPLQWLFVKNAKMTLTEQRCHLSGRRPNVFRSTFDRTCAIPYALVTRAQLLNVHTRSSGFSELLRLTAFRMSNGRWLQMAVNRDVVPGSRTFNFNLQFQLVKEFYTLLDCHHKKIVSEHVPKAGLLPLTQKLSNKNIHQMSSSYFVLYKFHCNTVLFLSVVH